MAQYDPENIFSKIIDGKVPCFKVFESKFSLAFLDAFPVVTGHTLIVPKAKGYTSFLEMPADKAADFLSDLQKVSAAVREATGATAINIWQNNGQDAGQTVFHPHFHIVPRYPGDNLFKYPASKETMISEDEAAPLAKKINDQLHPPKPLKKAKFVKVESIDPDSKGLNLHLKIVEEPKEAESKVQTFWEVLAADASGSVVLSLRESQKDAISVGKTYDIRNGGVKMVKGHVRVAVDKWGKIEPSDDDVEALTSPEKNVSATEYELVPGQ
jgi:histidine triad (HIT) family protein